MNSEILQNLIELNADEWNSSVSLQLGIPVESLRNTFNMRQTLSMTEEKSKLNIDNIKLDAIARLSVAEYEQKIKWASEQEYEKYKYIPPRDRFVNKISNDVTYEISAFACIGKIIVGIDFSQSGMERSIFNGCTFFNCTFDNTSFEGSTFLNCTFNLCDFSNSTCTRAQFSRCRFIDDTFDRAVLDYALFTDCILISCQFIGSSLIYSNISYCGLNECSFAQAILRNAGFYITSIISSNLSDASIRGSSFVDVALLRCDFTGADLLGVEYMAISAQEISYDGPFGEFFQMSRDSFSPGLREWDNASGIYSEEDVDDYIDGIDLDGGDSFDDIMGNDDDDDDKEV